MRPKGPILLTITPADEGDACVDGAHGAGKGERSLGGALGIPPAVAVGGLVAELPVTDIVGRFHTVAASQGVVGVVAVGQPGGGFFRAAHAGAAVWVDAPMVAAITLQVDADERRCAHLTAQAEELVGAHAVTLDAAPQQVVVRLALTDRPHTLVPAIVRGQTAAPTQHRGRQRAGGC